MTLRILHSIVSNGKVNWVIALALHNCRENTLAKFCSQKQKFSSVYPLVGVTLSRASALMLDCCHPAHCSYSSTRRPRNLFCQHNRVTSTRHVERSAYSKFIALLDGLCHGRVALACKIQVQI